MNEEKVNGIVIRAGDYRDNGRLVSLYTPECGKIQAVLRGVKSPKAKMKCAAQLFHFGEYLFTPNKGGFRVVAGCAPFDSFSGIYAGGRPDAYFSASFMLELLNKATPDAEPNPEIFILILKSLRELLKKEVDPALAAAHFTLHFLRASGFRYIFDECAACGAPLSGKRKFDALAGGITCPHCGGPFSVRVSAVTGSVLRILNASPHEDLCRFVFEDGDTADALGVLIFAAKHAFGIELTFFGNNN